LVKYDWCPTPTIGGIPLTRRLKRSSRANPREDRNYENPKSSRNNIIELDQFSTKSTKQKKVELVPKNIHQEEYIDYLENPDINIVFAIGPAGTGKSYLATLYAIKCLQSGAVDKIVITRPNVAVDDRDIGFLPGDIYAKLAPWVRPILDILEEFYPVKTITSMIENNIIELLPIAHIRGRTLKRSIILVDEAQNTTPSSMLSTLTRIGEGSKMVVTGDTKQSDRGGNNGLTDFLDRSRPNKYIAIAEFDRKDIERHPAISTILNWYGEE
jgi:phosphate starvation-inducible PhoH-like protein